VPGVGKVNVRTVRPTRDIGLALVKAEVSDEEGQAAVRVLLARHLRQWDGGTKWETYVEFSRT
jgi:hypothetical protein